jgi:GMP synthase-like glutamine amidotransferase
MRISILQCDVVVPELHHVAGGLPEMFVGLFGPSVNRIDVFDCTAGQLPQQPYGYDAHVVTGSRYAAFDNVQWIRALKRFIKECRYNKQTLIGICFGHQIIAEALGGTVERASGGWNLGMKELLIVQRTAWMEPSRPRVRLLFNHRDQVVRLPSDATLLAGDRDCPVQMYEIGNHILGLQGHPEYVVAYQEALMERIRMDVDPVTIATAVEANRQHSADSDLIRDWIIRFVSKSNERTGCDK